ncbi:lipoprotein releasing system, transmembrane protein, LolC/E family [Peptoniphilus indolicus]|uniref:Lipoprotein releasing system, transmembrane protein, LolC/E family n=4 Tax=Peptoniphilus indolicus TaxID=33030 RepID=A0A379DCT0_9FIRM|nr:FtsX-like permease family protein [Peptoniphilus indolicus]SUB75365.1 lipoprotein releasing system, transmembrane protein, LolC/E family [Peptoniphilus indolicus]
MKVKNKSYIRRLAKSILNANKSRRNILLLAIALTSILFTSLFSVALGLGKSMETQTMKTIGTISHGSFKDICDEDVEILTHDKDIRDFSVREKVGILDDEKVMAELSYMDKKGFEWSLIEKVKGKFPEKENQVFIDIATAKKLGYKGEIGEEIEVPFKTEKPYTGEIIEKKSDKFIISGTFQSPIDSNVGVGQIYLSKAYVDKLSLPENNKDLEVMLKNSFMIRNKLLKIAERNGYKVVEDPGNLSDNEIRIGVNFAYLLSGDNSFDFNTFLPYLAFLILVMVAGYLIINNIFKISVNEDIKLLGLLKKIGMTKPQIKRLIHFESLAVALPSIVVGDLVGISIGKIILNKIFANNEMLTDVKLSFTVIILIILFSTVFTLLTVFLSVMKPARYAAKVSPIDASRYNETTIKKKYKSENISLGKLARRQVFSNKFRFISIVLSISLSAVILNSVLTYTGNIDLEKGISDVIVTDYNIASPKYFRYMYLDSEYGIDKKYIDEIEKHKGYKSGGALYSSGYEHTYPKIKIEDNKVAPLLFGMDDYLINKQKFIDGEFDKEKWKTGNYVIIGERIKNNSDYKTGDTIKINVKNRVKEVQVMGKVEYNFSNGLRYFPVIKEDINNESSPTLGLEYIYMNPNEYKELTGDKSIMSYGFDVEDSEKENFDKLLKSFENEPEFSYDSRDLQIKSFKDFKNLIEFVGYSLSIVLFLISVLNFINIIATEILRNMVNLSILESIGLTKKNIKKYLVKKNLIYSLCGLVFSFIIMLLVDKYILIGFMEQTKWTSYKFVIMPLILVNFVNIIIGIIFTGRFYEKHSQNSLVDRIRSLE